MRRSGYVSLSIAALVLVSRPDAAFVPAARVVSAAPRPSIVATARPQPRTLPVAGTIPAGFTQPSTNQQITVTVNP